MYVSKVFCNLAQGCRRADFSAKFAYFGRIRPCLAVKKNLRPKAENGIFGAELAEFLAQLAELAESRIRPKLLKNVQFSSFFLLKKLQIFA